MEKEEIAEHYELMIAKPSKDGGYLASKIIEHASGIMHDSRDAIVSVFKEWLQPGRRSHVSLGIAIIGELHLVELKSDLEDLQRRIAEGSMKFNRSAKMVHLMNIAQVLRELE
jgi:hypothetical protein